MPGTVVRYTRPGKRLRNHGESSIFNEKIHYFDWAIFNSELFVYQRVANFGTKKTTNMDKSSELSFDLVGFYSDLMGFEWIQKIILKASKQASQQASKPASQQASKPASQQASKPASQQASKPASQQASKRASEQQASKRASEQASKRASEQASKQASK